MANINKVALLNNGKVVGAGRNKDNSNLAPIEATTTASRSYLVGDYLMLQGEFYKVISAIAIGDTLTVGTNIQATNVASVLTELNNRIDNISTLTSMVLKTTDYPKLGGNGAIYMANHFGRIQFNGFKNLVNGNNIIGNLNIPGTVLYSTTEIFRSTEEYRIILQGNELSVHCYGNTNYQNNVVGELIFNYV